MVMLVKKKFRVRMVVDYEYGVVAYTPKDATISAYDLFLDTMDDLGRKTMFDSVEFEVEELPDELI